MIDPLPVPNIDPGHKVFSDAELKKIKDSFPKHNLADAQGPIERVSIKDDYDNLLSGIKNGIIDSIVCDIGGDSVKIPNDFSTGYNIGCLILEIYKHVQSLPQANNQEG